MKKLLNLGLILASLIGYLEWGGGNSAFLGQTEYQLIFVERNPEHFMHPFVILPLLGQVLLLITLFQKVPNKILTYTGLACLSVLLLFIFLIGAIGGHILIMCSAVPFVVLGVLTVRAYRKQPVV